MSHKDAEIQNKQQQRENERRVDELINLVENKTRSERHLEQHSDIGDPDRLQHVHEVQHERENQIQDLKSAIVYGDSAKNNTEHQIESLQKNYNFTQGYMEHNADHMNPQVLENLKEKQQNRKEQLNTLQ